VTKKNTGQIAGFMTGREKKRRVTYPFRRLSPALYGVSSVRGKGIIQVRSIPNKLNDIKYHSHRVLDCLSASILAGRRIASASTMTTE